ncbi:MAG: citrate lyase holo-[Prevotella sp.]|nr:citrate lyase holo-[acyl-carrier protein] synthase [Prevotella sp.]
MHNSLYHKSEDPATEAAPQAISLEELLRSRDERSKLQHRLLAANPGMTVVMLTIVMPGTVKRNSLSLRTGRAAIEALAQAFSKQPTVRDLNTGFEAYLLTPLPPSEAKRKACRIEEEHPLGRLFDIDIIDQRCIPVERSTIGLPPRRCLLCHNEARYCMRNHSHTREEVLQRIKEMVENYV